jgi:hypothetical protein
MGRPWPLCSPSSPSTPTNGPTSAASTSSSRRPSLTWSFFKNFPPTTRCICPGGLCWLYLHSLHPQAGLQRPHHAMPCHPVPPACHCPGGPAWEGPAGYCWGPSFPQHVDSNDLLASFTSLRPQLDSPISPVLIGDFNCVQDPLDYTQGGHIRPPCPSLGRILGTYSYMDSFRSLHRTSRIYSFHR